jgi:hypothetical protein
MFKAASASSMNPSAEPAAAECAAQIEDAGLTRPDFVIVHCNCALSLRDIGRVLRERWQGVRLHAATSCLGGMTDKQVAMSPDAGLALLAFSDPAGEYGIASGGMSAGSRGSGRELAQRALEDAGRAGEIPALVLVCATPGEEEEFLAGVQSVVGSGTPVIGGSAADNDISGSWRILHGSEALSDAAVVSVLFPSVAVSTAFESAYAPSEHRGVVSAAKGRRILEIDGAPAADVYERWSEGAVRRPASGATNILMQSALMPLGRVAGFLVDMPIYNLSHPETISADGSLSLFTRIDEGDEVVFMKGTSTTLVNRASNVLRSASRFAELDPAQVSAMVMYYCGGCMLQVRDRLDDIQTSLTRTAPGVPMVVGFTFGEQGCLSKGSAMHGNLMISSIVFGR